MKFPRKKRGAKPDNVLSAYRIMWIQVLFDLPVVEDVQRKAATQFRNYLLELGFEMAQYSVYQRFCQGMESAETYVKKIEKNLPNEGKIHILFFTDKQFASIRTYTGPKRKAQRQNPDQLELF